MRQEAERNIIYSNKYASLGNIVDFPIKNGSNLVLHNVNNVILSLIFWTICAKKRFVCEFIFRITDNNFVI